MSSIKESIVQWLEDPPDLSRESDFSTFWQKSVTEIFPPGTNDQSMALLLEEIPYCIKRVRIHKAALRTHDGALLKGWYCIPSEAGLDHKVPGLIRFHGYSSNKGKINELLLWALQGYAVLAMDVRGQCGESPDPRIFSSGAFSGWLTRGLGSPEEYYYRQVYLDALQQITALSGRPEVEASKIGLFGNSQGGGIALAVAALHRQFIQASYPSGTQVAAVSANIPFLADMKHAFREHRDGPWQEFHWYFRMQDPYHEREEEIFRLLSYFDVMNLAPWIRCPVLLSTGLMDTSCPPATAYSVYHHLGGEKEIVPYPNYGHENNDVHLDRQIAFLADRLLPD